LLKLGEGHIQIRRVVDVDDVDGMGILFHLDGDSCDQVQGDQDLHNSAWYDA